MKKINYNKIESKRNKIKTKLKNATSKSKKKNYKKKNNKFWYWFLVCVTGGAILVFFLAIAFGIYIIFSAPTFDPDMLYEKESSVIYDASGTLIATLGTATGEGTAEKRKKISYEDLSQVLIDAIVATEDSRYFQHNGFDLARFAKASFGQLLGQSDSGGASTLTMQVVKNTFTSNVASGVKGIIRKFTDIYMAIFKVEKNYTKEEILEFYVNSPYLGSGSYGVEQASQVYFGKSASDLSLPEAALIAGLFQAPNAYDPYIDSDAAEARRNIVLNLMVRHGYISEEQATAAKAIKVKDMLVNDSSYNSNPYQGFIDTAVQEVIDKTGQNPYSVPMEIYTTMITSKQDVINQFYNEELSYKFDEKHKKMQVAISVLDNDTGAIVAVGAGRNRTGEMSYNYATMIKRHPGSTAKPIFDYAPGMEYLKWSTYTPFFDEETTYSNGKSMNNWNHKYEGLVTLKEALSASINTTALRAFKKVNNSNIYKFATSLGLDVEDNNGKLHEAHSIGSFSGVSPTSLAGAYSAFANGGYYTEPYSVIKIVYKETGEVYEPKIKKERVMSASTAFMITDVLFKVTPGSVRVKGTRVATKTGTSSYESSALKAAGIKGDAIQDSWVATYSPKYTMAFWLGYDELSKDDYFTMGYASQERNEMQGALVNKLFETNSSFKRPSNVVAVEVELETIPAMKPSEYTPEDLRETHYFISGTEPTEISNRFTKLSDPTDVTIIESGSTASISWTAAKTPEVIDNTYLTNYFKNGYEEFSDKYLALRNEYNKNVLGELGYVIYLKKGSELVKPVFTVANTLPIEDIQGYDGIVIKTQYEKFSSNASDGVTKAFSGNSNSLDIELLAVNGYINPTIKVGSTLPKLDSSTIMVSINGIEASITGSVYTISYEIKNDISHDLLNDFSDIDTSVEGSYTITYRVECSGAVSTEKRRITIEK